MIGLDTNVLVRYFAQDDLGQAARANEVIDRLTESQPGFVSTIVMVETYWVLRRAYKADQDLVVATLHGLLESKEVTVERPETVWRALRRAAGGADFADALINEVGQDAGCEHTVTFDRRAAQNAGMQLLE